jgi:hypothetical protein
MRCDVNVSVRCAGSETLGTKVEVKNMNSFSAMQKAIDFEVARQSQLLRTGRGEDIVQETRLFDEGRQVCTPEPHSFRGNSLPFVGSHPQQVSPEDRTSRKRCGSLSRACTWHTRHAVCVKAAPHAGAPVCWVLAPSKRS